MKYITCCTKNNVVFGPPGSGKSTALKGRIEHLVSVGSKLSSQLVMTFYVTTKENLNVKLQETFGAHTSRQVRTVHSICWNLLPDGEKDVSTAIVRVIRLDNSILAAYFNGISHIYVDESQLLDNTSIDFIKKIREACPYISVDLLGDPAQNCKTHVSCEEEEFMMQYSGPGYEFLNNYRSCASIVNFCNLTHPFVQTKPMRSVTTTADGGKCGTFLFCGTRDEQLTFLFQWIESLPKNETKAILCACRHPHASMATHICCQDVTNTLSERNVSFHIWYDETKNHSEFSSVRKQENELIISTIQGVLGREFDHVIQFSYHHRLNKRIPTMNQHYYNSKLNHIARSRGKQTFTMCCGHDMEMFMTPEKAMGMIQQISRSTPKLIKNIHKKGVFADRDDDEEDNSVRLGSLQNIPPEKLMRIQDLFQATAMEKKQLWSLEKRNFPEYDALCTLYGNFAESFIVFVCTGCFPDLTSLRSFIETSTIRVTDGERDEVQYIIKELNLHEKRMHVSVTHIESFRTRIMMMYHTNVTKRRMKKVKFLRGVIDILNGIISRANAADQRIVSIHFENKNIWCDFDALKNLSNLSSSADLADVNTAEKIFRICLFWWQYENQAKWRMNRVYSEHLDTLKDHINEWIRFGTELRMITSAASLETQVPVILVNSKFADKRILGAIDGLLSPFLYEFKFSQSEISNIHRLQASLYSYAVYQNSGVQYKPIVINLCTGEMEMIQNNDSLLSNDIFDAFFSTPPEHSAAGKYSVSPSLPESIGWLSAGCRIVPML